MTRWSLAAPLAALALTAAGCAPLVRPRAGAPTPEVALPRTALAPTPQRLVFRWRYDEAEGFSARGEGVARLAPPDSGRLDFFVDGGMGGGYAVLIGDRVSAPGGDMIRRLIPPAPLLWAALGRLALPAASDTTVRSSGDTVRADVGRGPTWRVTYVAGRLRRIERIDGGRIQEWVQRDSSAVRYRHEGERRALSLDVQRTETVDAFPASIWPR
ncbi:hypothetical protein [Roseisolibacter sp. H3M3-2]|uniref:hypothetical protein n=1 Tax=Roseisolibacter sp. H3M3-2 TaxID=3031323 RepID=UPI0023D9DAE7|nr:hypothetical protein [Roseisolibacter sp. H3M3-2]MDF1505071.1 hypothetical protein [Roseisolibacter sp. H3M3-2]